MDKLLAARWKREDRRDRGKLLAALRKAPVCIKYAREDLKIQQPRARIRQLMEYGHAIAWTGSPDGVVFTLFADADTLELPETISLQVLLWDFVLVSQGMRIAHIGQFGTFRIYSRLALRNYRPEIKAWLRHPMRKTVHCPQDLVGHSLWRP
ncbi:MAG: helix-turn-helix domain-containing protein [Methylococcus sp.]|nr:helix-turn-helix domain-containing protein [Methylococcus sp.]